MAQNGGNHHVDPSFDDIDTGDFQSCVGDGESTRTVSGPASSSNRQAAAADSSKRGAVDDQGPPTAGSSMQGFDVVGSQPPVEPDTRTNRDSPSSTSNNNSSSKRSGASVATPPAAKDSAPTPSNNSPARNSGGGISLQHQASNASNSTTDSSFSAVTPTTPYSPMSHHTQQQKGQIQDLVIGIKIGSARIGNELVKPLTYFSVNVTIARIPLLNPHNSSSSPTGGGASSASLINMVPTTASDMNPWTKNLHPTTADRRYSEFVELRKYLSYFFPWLIIPPLPAKSQSETMQTFMADPDSLSRQRVNLQRFVDEVRCMPELLQAKVFQDFCQTPRDSTDFIGLMDRLRECNRKLDSEHGVVSGAYAGVAGATKAMKSLASTVTGWFSAGTGASSDRDRIPQDLDTQVSMRLEQSEEYRHWVHEQEELVKLKAELTRSVAPLAAVLKNQKEMVDCYGDMSTILHDYASDLSSCSGFASLGQHAEQASKFTRALRSIKLDQTQKDESQLVAAMEHELHWVQAAHDACGTMMSVIRQDFQNAIIHRTVPFSNRPRPAVFVPPAGVDLISRDVRLEQCVTLHGCLAETVSRFRVVHQKRLADIFAGKARHALHYINKEMEMYADRQLHFDLLLPQKNKTAAATAGGGEGGGSVPTAEPSKAWLLVGDDNREEQEIEDREAALTYFTEMQQRCQVDIAARDSSGRLHQGPDSSQAM